MPLVKHKDGYFRWNEPTGRGSEHHGNFAYGAAGRMPAAPSNDPPGSIERVAELARRANANEHLWHPLDRMDWEDVT